VFLNEFFCGVDCLTNSGACLIDDITGNTSYPLSE
jgi:hypothetical protein